MAYLTAGSVAIAFVALCLWLEQITDSLRDLADPVDTSDWPDGPDDY